MYKIRKGQPSPLVKGPGAMSELTKTAIALKVGEQFVVPAKEKPKCGAWTYLASARKHVANAVFVARTLSNDDLEISRVR